MRVRIPLCAEDDVRPVRTKGSGEVFWVRVPRATCARTLAAAFSPAAMRDIVVHALPARVQRWPTPTPGVTTTQNGLRQQVNPRFTGNRGRQRSALCSEHRVRSRCLEYAAESSESFRVRAESRSAEISCMERKSGAYASRASEKLMRSGCAAIGAVPNSSRGFTGNAAIGGLALNGRAAWR